MNLIGHVTFKAKYFQTFSSRAPLPIPDPTEIQGGIDFSQGERRPDGRLCVIKETEVDQVVKDPILECTHRNIEKCHYTYITQFKPAQEEVVWKF